MKEGLYLIRADGKKGNKMKFEDLTGKVFGKLTVIKRVGNFDGTTDMRSQYLVKCSCGNEQEVVARYLKNGGRKSCYACSDKKEYGSYDGKSKYWGANAKLFTERV